MADRLTEKIIAAAIEVHKTLGSGLLESIYEEALCIEFELMGLPFQRQLAVDVMYKGRAIQGQRLDLLVAMKLLWKLNPYEPCRKCGDSPSALVSESDGLEARIIAEFWRKTDGQRSEANISVTSVFSVAKLVLNLRFSC